MLKKWKNQVLYRLRTQTSRYAEISQDSSIENRRTVPEFGFAEFWSFVPLQRKTQCLRQNLVAKAANFPVIKDKGYYNADFFTMHKSK